MPSDTSSDPPRIIITVGLPGAGKSTYLAGLGISALSSDAIRQILADDVTDQTIHERVFATLRYLVQQRLDIGRPFTYVDATHLTPAERWPYIEIARARNCTVEALFFDVPLEVCLARNGTRSRVVPEDALRAMAAKLIPPTVNEGFSRVTVVRC